jgi:hypothetical protein
MIGYRYTIENQSIETIDLINIPEGLDYEIIEIDETVDMAFLINQALEIDLYYTELISDLLRKHIEKLSIDNIPIPEDVIIERDRLRAECNQKIMELGITDFTYRQQNIRL